MPHKITVGDVFEGDGKEISKELASSFGGGSDKTLLLTSRFAGFFDGRIIGASIEFRVTDHNMVVIETDSVDDAISAYNSAP